MCVICGENMREKDGNRTTYRPSLLYGKIFSDMAGTGHGKTLSNDENFKSILKDSVKYNIDIIINYFNINNLHFKLSFKPKRFEDIY